MALLLFRMTIWLLCACSFFYLLYRFVRFRNQWNPKTRDYWYALTMWSFAGMSLTSEAIIRHTPFRVSVIFVFAASVVSLIGLRRTGGWGSDS